MTTIIENLIKVTVNISKANDLENPATSFSFIYGVASEGLCPFEKQLHGKRIADTITIKTSAAKAGEYFGHLLLPLRQELGLQHMPETISLRVEVTEISEAENREVVESMARALASGGCGGSCGCGCG